MTPLLTILLLLVAAMVLGFLEILTPSFGVLAVGAVAALIASIWLAFGYAGWLGWSMLVGAIIIGPMYVSFLVKLIPKTPLGKRLFLAKAPDGTGQGTPEADTYGEMIGKTGTAATLLRPGGMVQIGANRIPAQAETGMIEKDTPIVVVSADSMNVIVRAADPNN